MQEAPGGDRATESGGLRCRRPQQLARKHAPEAIKTLAEIAKEGTPSARVSAAIALLDRAYGKPPQFNTGDATNFRKAVDMSDDELAAIIARAKLTVV